MQESQLVDLSVAEIMSRWPSTIRVFIVGSMHCVGCPISPFHTLAEAAEEHGRPLPGLLAEVLEAIGTAEARDSRA